jgi:uncharacterized membrane protein YdbT with pleckstrin-like domain
MAFSFIENNLIPGEKIVYRAIVAWYIYIETFLWLVITGVLVVFGSVGLNINHRFLSIIAGVMLVIVVRSFLTAFIHQYSTEMAITDRRIIAKFGLIRRDVIELPLERVESVFIDQSILERIMDAGSVAVRGTGVAMAPVRFIDKPVEFRNKLNEAIAANKSKQY